MLMNKLSLIPRKKILSSTFFPNGVVKNTEIIIESSNRYETYQMGFKFEGLDQSPSSGLRGWVGGGGGGGGGGARPKLNFFRIWSCCISN